MKADGSDLRSVASSPGGYRVFPTWAPNGKIFFLRNGDVFAIKPDGSGLVRLTKRGDVVDYALSPDNKRMAVHDVNSHRLLVIPVQGRATPVTLLAPISDFITDPYAPPAWTPDGKALAVASSDWQGEGSRLYVVNADRSVLSAVPGAGMALDPAWRPR